MKYSILLPTRKRPDSIVRFLTFLSEATENPDNVEVVIRYDHDDFVTINNLSLFSTLWKNIRFIQGVKPEYSGSLWNECFYASTGEIVFVAGDDIVFRTRGWDTIIANEYAKYPDGILIIHGQDTIYGDALGTHPFVHRNWVNTLGRLAQDGYIYWWDVWIDHCSRAINRRVFLPSVITEHLHFTNNKSEMDETYSHNRRLVGIEEPKFFSEGEGKRRAEDCEKLKAFIQKYAENQIQTQS
jgi:hypothetical protein